MKTMTLSAFVSSWLLISPAVWAHRPAKAILAMAVGLIAMVLSPFGVFWPPARRIIAIAGVILMASNFAVFDNLGIIANHAGVGFLLLFAGFAPEIRRYPAEALAVEVAPAAVRPGEPQRAAEMAVVQPRVAA
jgi:hypothetical protein